MTARRDLALLAGTQRPRCLGCAWPLTDRGDRTCTCPTYYGTGNRVDYDLWCELTRSSEPMFRVWAEAEPMGGVPSWWPTVGRPPTARYHDTHPAGCNDRRCVPSLEELRRSHPRSFPRTLQHT